MKYFLVYVARLQNKTNRELTGNFDAEISGKLSDINKIRKVESLIEDELLNKGLYITDVTIISWRQYDT